MLLSLACLGIASTAPSRVRAGTEIDAEGFAGSTAGSWACGPVTRVNYGGGGARLRFTEERAPLGGSGFTAEAGGAAVSEANHFVRCTGETCDEADHVMPAARVLFGGNTRVGYQGKVFGAEGGAEAFQYWAANTDGSPALRFLPDVQVSVRHEDIVKVMAGFGSPTVSTLTRPGLYLGSRVPISRFELEAYAGLFRSGPSEETAGLRADIASSVVLTPDLKVRFGASASEARALAGFEGNAGLILDL